MGDVMLLGVLQMPYDMAMDGEIARRQYHSRGQEAARRIEADAAALAEAQARVDKLEAWANRQNEVIDNAVAERTEELRSELGHADELLAEAQAEIARLRGLLPNPDETPDEILWRDYMRGVHPDLLAKQRKVTRERMRLMLRRITERRAALEAKHG